LEQERLVLFTEGEKGPSCGLDAEIIRRAGGMLRCVSIYDPAERIRAAQQADALVINQVPITRDFLATVPRLKGIVRTGIGVDTIDLEAATDAGVVIANVPEFCREEVAEHALGLIFSVARKITLSDRLVRRGGWYEGVNAEMLPMRQLSGQTLGLIGLGRIGQTVAQKARGLGLKVIGYDPQVDPKTAAAAGIQWLELDEVMRKADIVSLHVPATTGTRRIINQRTLSLMKPGSILINTARGSVVDEVALEAALASGKLAGAGLDVLEKEPPLMPHSLFKFETVVITCHYASCSIEAYARLSREVAEQAAEIINGKLPRNLVNARVKDLPQCRVGK
jgi:D-3-phosphoglycerate dehydrogenase / 2-oxoglutarate reductase